MKDSSSSLKKLQTTITKHERQIAANSRTATELEKENANHRNCISELLKQIEALKDGPIIVTEHAYLRYLERVVGMSRQEVYGKIVTQKVEDIIRTLGEGEFTTDGYRIIFRDNTVITITPTSREVA